ncbi:MAG: radical SAM protein [Chloroflexia bacterium]|nr:radical SAM protein [Chloroflexia bacterium]
MGVEGGGDERAMLNVGAWMERSVANGPGERFVLWLQGCPLRCPDCFNPEFLPLEPRHLVTVPNMAARILALEGIEGVTYSGGEPTLQAEPLCHLSQRLREAGLSIVCYSGYTLEQLRDRDDPWIERLLSYLDILIDGPYLCGQAANLPWRGSRNQRVHFLSPTYRHLAPQIEGGPAEVELAVGRDGFAATGNWPAEFWERLRKALER